MPGVQLFAGSLKAGLQRVSVPGDWIAPTSRMHAQIEPERDFGPKASRISETIRLSLKEFSFPPCH